MTLDSTGTPAPAAVIMPAGRFLHAGGAPNIPQPIWGGPAFSRPGARRP